MFPADFIRRKLLTKPLKQAFGKSIMFSSRTWHWLCLSAYIIFPGLIMVWLVPETSNLFMVSMLMIAWAILIGILGALQAVLLVLGRLKYGCPWCKAPSPVIKGNRNILIINCSA